MNREEALREMRDGAKVRHQYFTSEDYLFIDSYNRIMTEDGCEFAREFFNNDFFETGWSVVKKKQSCNPGQ